MTLNQSHSSSKVYYRALEAAIRLSGLAAHEASILREVEPTSLPDAASLTRWPELHYHAMRLLDAIHHRELPCGIDGIATHGNVVTTIHHITVRHVDLKAWMQTFYPEERPGFLFGCHDLVPKREATQEPPLSQRRETTLLNIIGGLLTLLLGPSYYGTAPVRFATQDKIITALLKTHGGRLGITRRTLEAKFAQAKRSL